MEGRGPGFHQILLDTCLSFSSISTKSFKKKTAPHHVPFYCPRVCEPWWIYLPDERERQTLAWGLLDSHKAETFHCAEHRGSRNQRSQSPRAAALTLSPAPTLSYNPNLSWINKKLMESHEFEAQERNSN